MAHLNSGVGVPTASRAQLLALEPSALYSKLSLLSHISTLVWPLTSTVVWESSGSPEQLHQLHCGVQRIGGPARGGPPGDPSSRRWVAPGLANA